MELLKNLEGLTPDEQITAVVELQKKAMAHLEEQKQATIGKSAELVIQGLKKIKADFEAKFDSLNYDIQTKVASLKDGEQGIQGPKGDQGDRGLDGANGRDGRDGKDGRDGLDGVDGVGVRDAKIDFDGSLVISLTDGREINCGEVVSVDVAKQIQKVTHNIQTGAGGDSQTVLDAIAALQATIATYGTMATQNKTSVDIEGGTIDNTVIGGTTPAAGTFTTLTATGQTSLGGVAGSESLRVNVVASAVNYLTASGSTSGSAVTLGAAGLNGGIATIVQSKGSGTVEFWTNGGNQRQAVVSHTASAVNYVQVTGAATGSAPTISAQGSDSNIDFSIATKGTGAFNFFTRSTARQFEITNTASSVNWLRANGSATGQGVQFSAQGSDTNIDLNLTTKGTGSFKINNAGGTVAEFNDGGAANPTNSFLFAAGGGGIRALIRAMGGPMTLLSTGTNPVNFATNGSSGNIQAVVSHTASAVNYVQVTGAATGSNPTISAQGSDATRYLSLTGKGSAGVALYSNGGSNLVFLSNHVASSVNYMQVAAAVAGSSPAFSVNGSDTNIDLTLTPKGTGRVQFGTYTANMALTVQGYIEIKDSGGTVRKLAVIA